MTKVVVVVKDGRVEAAYCRNKNVEVEVLDFYDSGDESEYKDKERRLDAVESSKTYKDAIIW
jgi:hypothetical protein